MLIAHVLIDCKKGGKQSPWVNPICFYFQTVHFIGFELFRNTSSSKYFYTGPDFFILIFSRREPRTVIIDYFFFFLNIFS